MEFILYIFFFALGNLSVCANCWNFGTPLVSKDLRRQLSMELGGNELELTMTNSALGKLGKAGKQNPPPPEKPGQRETSREPDGPSKPAREPQPCPKCVSPVFWRTGPRRPLWCACCTPPPKDGKPKQWIAIVIRDGQRRYANHHEELAKAAKIRAGIRPDDLEDPDWDVDLSEDGTSFVVTRKDQD